MFLTQLITEVDSSGNIFTLIGQLLIIFGSLFAYITYLKYDKSIVDEGGRSQDSEKHKRILLILLIGNILLGILMIIMN